MKVHLIMGFHNPDDENKYDELVRILSRYNYTVTSPKIDYDGSNDLSILELEDDSLRNCDLVMIDVDKTMNTGAYIILGKSTMINKNIYGISLKRINGFSNITTENNISKINSTPFIRTMITKIISSKNDLIKLSK